MKSYSPFNKQTGAATANSNSVPTKSYSPFNTQTGASTSNKSFNPFKKQEPKIENRFGTSAAASSVGATTAKNSYSPLKKNDSKTESTGKRNSYAEVYRGKWNPFIALSFFQSLIFMMGKLFDG